MTSPFKLNDLPESWTVTWPTLNYAKLNRILGNHTILDVAFSDLKLKEIDLGVQLYNEELEVVNVNFYDWASKHFDEHFCQMYVIGGAKFDSVKDAERFLHTMEQYYIMYKLKEPA